MRVMSSVSLTILKKFSSTVRRKVLGLSKSKVSLIWFGTVVECSRILENGRFEEGWNESNSDIKGRRSDESVGPIERYVRSLCGEVLKTDLVKRESICVPREEVEI